MQASSRPCFPCCHLTPNSPTGHTCRWSNSGSARRRSRAECTCAMPERGQDAQPPHRQHTSKGHLTQHISKPCSCATAGVRFYRQPAGQPSASPCAARRSVRPAVRSARDPQRSDTISFTFLPCSSSGGRNENGCLSGPSCAIPPLLYRGAQRQVGARTIPRKVRSLQSHAMQLAAVALSTPPLIPAGNAPLSPPAAAHASAP